MLRKLLITTFCVFLTLVCAPLFADKAIIVHPSNKSSMDEAEIKKLFLGKSKSFPDGGSAQPFNLKESDATRQHFEKVILKKLPSQVKSYWAKLVFTGKASPPKEVSTAAEMKKVVSENPEAIGYIDASEADSSVRIVVNF